LDRAPDTGASAKRCSVAPLGRGSESGLGSALSFFVGHVMGRPGGQAGLTWWELATLGLLATLVVLGLAANGQTLVGAVVAVGYGAAVLGVAWLWQRSRRRWEELPGGLWASVVFLLWLSVMGLLVWQWQASRDGARPGGKAGHQESQEGD
jgi:hypothetical protein